MSCEELCSILHELYPDFKIKDSRPFGWVFNSMIVWEEETDREYLFVVGFTGDDDIVQRDGQYCRYYTVHGILSLTNQQLFEEYIKGEYSHEKCNRLYPSID